MKISNFKFQISNIQAGFTLIELLAVIVVFTAVGSIAGSILVNSLRTSNKANVITTAKENGNYAISQMAKLLRNATSLQSPYPCVTPAVVSSLTVRESDGNNVTLDCNATDPSTNKTTIASNSAPLLDTSNTGVKLTSCTFTCSQTTQSDYPLISILFSLGTQSSSTFSEKSASATPITFSTSVLLENINR